MQILPKKQSCGFGSKIKSMSEMSKIEIVEKVRQPSVGVTKMIKNIHETSLLFLRKLSIQRTKNNSGISRDYSLSFSEF